MKRRKIVTVAIAAHNSERNIKKLIKALLNQRILNFQLKDVIVHSDCSTDRTVKIVTNIKTAPIKVMESKTRLGFSGSIMNIIKNNKSDILIILNDDIVIYDDLFLEKLLKPFNVNKRLGLVSCNIQAFKPNNYIDRAALAGFSVYKKLGEKINFGSNAFTCDGKALGFSKSFANSVKFPSKLKEMGNADGFLYLSCVKNGFDYEYVKDAILYFKLPTTFKDFTNWQIRNYKSNKYVLRKRFGKLAEEELRIPTVLFNYYKLIEFMTHPVESIFIQLIGIYCIYKAFREKREFNSLWEIVQTTKDIYGKI